ncbi:hypothetical protein L195_g064309, partial [Trifolium pratense]
CKKGTSAEPIQPLHNLTRKNEPPRIKYAERPDFLWWVTCPAKVAKQRWKPLEEPENAK